MKNRNQKVNGEWKKALMNKSYKNVRNSLKKKEIKQRDC